MISFLRKHWFDMGGLLAVIAFIMISTSYRTFTHNQLLMWISLVSLFLHQIEEYRFPGYFPGMINAKVYKSNLPDRFPLNTQTSLIINVGIGWTLYLLAAIFANDYIWLGIAAIMISLGNVFAHTLFFNIKGKTWYNPGCATAVIFFLPLAICFFTSLVSNHQTRYVDWIIGIPLGVLCNYLGILKSIDWMADRNTPYIFSNRQLEPADRLKTY
jgi:hypothetical protein